MQARAKKWKVVKTNTILGLPPDEDSFCQYLLLANYQAKVWDHFEFASAPVDPQHNGYTFNGQYLPLVCYTKVACPDVPENLNADESNSDSECDFDESSDEDLCQSNETSDGNED